ncbi:MAG TPA: nucleotide exchange factor GrpE [Acidimicrobiales bacterium]|nr:nucleotide exchange factor GrpE [Acidimicrobiales bacterium]
MSEGERRPPAAGAPPEPERGEDKDRADRATDDRAMNDRASEDSDREVGDAGVIGEPVDAGAAAADDQTLAALATQRDEYLDALRRLQADFENYKKRVLKQQTEHLERAAEALVVKLLPVLDALDLAVAHAGDSPEAKVLAPVASSLVDVLEKEGLERIDPEGQPFDPNQHDAVMHEPPEANGEQEEHNGSGGEPQVSGVMRAGYRWKGRVLRPAMVKVKG